MLRYVAVLATHGQSKDASFRSKPKQKKIMQEEASLNKKSKPSHASTTSVPDKLTPMSGFLERFWDKAAGIHAGRPVNSISRFSADSGSGSKSTHDSPADSTECILGELQLILGLALGDTLGESGNGVSDTG